MKQPGIKHRADKQKRFAVYGLAVATLLAGGVLAWQALVPQFMSLQYLYRVIVHGESSVTDWQTIFPKRDIANNPASISPLPLAEASSGLADKWSLITYNKDGKEATIGSDAQAFLASTGTSSFIVVKDGRIVYEAYMNGASPDTVHTSMSVAKSFMSALVGVAINDGYVSSVDDPVVRYLPEFKGKISEDMTIRHLLTMSAGNAYDGLGGLAGDDTKTYWSDNIRALVHAYFRSAQAPGKHMDYNDFQPQVLGMILEKATGVTISQYMQEKIWKPAGMEAPASWSLDSLEDGFEQSAVGFNARSQDFARFGLLYLNNGTLHGQQIIPASWVAESTNTKQAGSSYYPAGGPEGTMAYGYYWWGHKKSDGAYDYYARGKYAQFIYVAPASNVVIVRTGTSVGGIKDWPLLLEQMAARL